MACTVYLVDGSSFLYRAYYALGALNAPDGRPVQAVFGFCRMTKKVIDRFAPEYLAVVWDSPGATFRHELFDGYKATRQKQPSDMADQKVLIQEFLTLIGVPQIAEVGLEADDLIASYARQAVAQGCTVVIITSDKDLGQLVNDHVTIFDPFKDALIDRAAIALRYGFPQERIGMYYALVGDSSDSIPGVRGIGPKAATDLVSMFASLDELYAFLEDPLHAADTRIKPRVRTLLVAAKEMAYLSQQLFTLSYIPVHQVLPDALRVSLGQYDQARLLFERLGFVSLLKSMPRNDLAGSVAQQQGLFGVETVIAPRESFAQLHGFDFELVTTREQLVALCREVVEAGIVAIDTETDGCAVRKATLVGISFCTRQGRAYYLPVAHQTDEAQIARDSIDELVGPLLADGAIKKIFHNAKFDLLVLQTAGFVVRGLFFDTMLAAGLLRGEGQKLGLKALSQELLGQPMHHFGDMVESQGLTSFAQVPVARALDYAAADAHQTFALYQLLRPRLEAEKVAALFFDVEMPLIQVLSAMEEAGMPLDIARLDAADVVATGRLAQLEFEIARFSGREPGTFNPRSPQQVADLLFVQLGLSPIKKTGKARAYSTDNESLQALADEHPVVALIIRHRELSKLKGTYINGLRQACDSVTGRIYTSFRQGTVATGRLSSADPNLQNIPTGAVEGISVRSFFVARPGYSLLSADYSQIELRVLAHLSGDPVLREAFLRGEDIHARTAAGLFGVGIDAVSYEQRQIAKKINFSILYGLSAFGLSKDLGIGVSEARTYLDRYQAQYPRVFAWMDEIIAGARVAGYVRTYLGRKRQLPELFEANKTLFQQGCRVAINTVAQGTAAELVKMGMIAVLEALLSTKLEARMILQVHDEVILEVANQDLAQAKAVVQQALESVVDWEIPLTVGIHDGRSWDEL